MELCIVCRLLYMSSAAEFKLTWICLLYEEVIGSRKGIHLVFMRGVSSRSPLNVRCLFQCLEMEWDSLL